MVRDYYIQGSARPRPAARAVIYCDGESDDRFRPDIDLELSHWIPNRTPARFKADTSTEICLRFVASGEPGFDLVINNHADVDGVLAVYTLVTGAPALAHRRTLIQAAEMGDFWASGDPPAQVLFQSLATLIRELRAAETDGHAIYERCLAHVGAVLAGAAPEVDGLAALHESVALVERGAVQRTVRGERFAQYVIPRALADGALDRALHVPAFCVPLSSACLLWPHARARFDRERVQLVSVEAAGGWYHDLWYPGHVWAETPHAWQPPGLAPRGGSNAQVLDDPALTRAVAALTERERGSGRWTLARHVTPFTTLEGRGFPVVLSFLGGTAPAVSSLAPDVVADHLVP